MREPSWRQQGEDPDYRFSLANERTFLAWIARRSRFWPGGVLLDQFSTRLQPHAVVLALAIALLAAVLCAMAYIRWRANEIAMRRERRLPSTLAIPLLAACSLAVAAVIALLLLAR
jgi:putative membrane protein